MAKTVRVRVITPHRQVLDEEAVSVQVPAEDGLFGVLAGHAPMISTVEAGILRIRREDSSQSEYIVTRGFAEVGRDQLRLAVDSGEPIDSIDLERAERAAERAKERLEEARARHVDQSRAEYSLRRALLRIRARRR